MDEYGVEESWTKQFKIKFSRLPKDFGQVDLMVLSISVHDGVILISDLKRLVFYDLKINYSLTCIIHHLVDKYDFSYPMPFVPDFVSFRNRQGWIADVV
ncbi:hypothetical protein LIER_27224 [Lithospermum erythrorhizon]|uniref:F-box protein n=1 Tax=Lithospermum erythrorhizon TaxID=34254 RepID=A0AAV3RDA3_LITER